MKHNIKINGYAYALLPIELSDAQLILDLRLEDKERNCYIHTIDNCLDTQRKWISNYLKYENSYYFKVVNNLTGQSEGLICIYNIQENTAEWGRWVIKQGSFAAIESVALIYEVAFDKLGLSELYTRTIEDNSTTVAFHNSIGAKFRKKIPNATKINNKTYNFIEQYVDKSLYINHIKAFLEQKCIKILSRNLRQMLGRFEFHHIGVATDSIEKELKAYSLLGYNIEGSFAQDLNQGVKGVFITAKSQPRLELLENLNEFNTLDYYIKNKIKLYHFAYFVTDIDNAFEFFVKKLKAKVVSNVKISTYFKKHICFLMLKNMWLIELIEM